MKGDWKSTHSRMDVMKYASKSLWKITLVLSNIISVTLFSEHDLNLTKTFDKISHEITSDKTLLLMSSPLKDYKLMVQLNILIARQNKYKQALCPCKVLFIRVSFNLIINNQKLLYQRNRSSWWKKIYWKQGI